MLWQRGGLCRPFVIGAGAGRGRVSFFAVIIFMGISAISPCWADAGDSPSRILERANSERGLGRDALRVIANSLDYGGRPRPLALQGAQRDALAAPLDLLDRPQAAFRRTLDAARWAPAKIAISQSSGLDLTEAVQRFELSSRQARRMWRESLQALRERHPEARATVVASLAAGDLPIDVLRTGLAVEIDRAIRNLGAEVMDLLPRLLASSGAPGRNGPMSPEIEIVRGTAGGDRFAPSGGSGILLIWDPGGDDRYDLSQLREGSVVIVVDEAGDDDYRGPGAILSATVVVDREGADRWGESISGAFFGVAAIADLQGDDRYESGYFGQAAAIVGRSLLVDLRGNDTYRLSGMGQGYAGPAGVAILQDEDGDDLYVATGAPDQFDRGGRISKAQGVGFGDRRGAAGGIGLLVDGGGNDEYRAELFAQGHGYFHGMGMLHDRAGADIYAAARYAQGSGAHFGIGVLQDESGDDRYLAEVGVGQGMGLDHAIGLLVDRGGNDRYEAGSLGQGASTANGLGVLVDGSGRDRFALRSAGWGAWHWSGGLPGFGALIGADADDEFLLAGTRRALSPVPPLGPASVEVPNVEGPTTLACPSRDSDRRSAKLGPKALEQAFPLAGESDSSIAAHWTVREALTEDLAAVVAAVGGNELAALGLLGPLHCLLQETDDLAHYADQLTAYMSRLDVPHVWSVAGALVRVDDLGDRVLSVAQALMRQSDCSGPVAAIEILRRHRARGAMALSPAVLKIVKTGLEHSCWRARAVALRWIDAFPEARLETGWQPSFLSDAALRRGSFPAP
jgi:hypothetical protein